MRAVKESLIVRRDSKVGDKEQLKCYTFGSDDPSKFAYLPAYEDEDPDVVAEQNQAKITGIKGNFW